MSLSLSIPDEAWEDQDLEYPRNRLITTLYVNGVPMHLEAWAVEGSPQTHPIYPDDLDHLAAAVEPGGPWVTWKIGDREYILVASPHAD
jgi:hypothetical protein